MIERGKLKLCACKQVTTTLRHIICLDIPAWLQVLLLALHAYILHKRNIPHADTCIAVHNKHYDCLSPASVISYIAFKLTSIINLFL